jgi:hypothetical protein
MKILHISHPYHSVTKSSGVIADLLSKLGHVRTEYIDPNHFEDVLPGLIDWNPQLVIISMHEFLAIPFLERGFNTWVVPMFDGIGGYTSDFWRSLKGVKVIAFSKVVHVYFKSLRIPSVHIRYFPELESDFWSTKKNCVKLWWRVPEINPTNIFSKVGHLVDSIDVRQGASDFLFDEDFDVSNHKINTCILPMNSSPHDYRDWLDGALYYAAPRKFEGIGLSLLEAMSHGMIPIASNNNVMNEYVRHGWNGFLIDFDSPNIVPTGYSTDKLLKNIETQFKMGALKYKSSSEQIRKLLIADSQREISRKKNVSYGLERFNFWKDKNGHGASKYTVSSISIIRDRFIAHRNNL